MKYIIFDMEWNQPSAENTKIAELTHGEIIQIGFFLLDDSLSVLHKEEFFIKPSCYKSMNKYVSALTGITQEDIDGGLPFSEAIEKMTRFFDEDTVIITWGDDDLPILRDNFRFHGIEDIKLPRHYNLQRIYSMQAGSEARQTGLKSALEALEITNEFQAHDALNDAYMTVLIAKKLELKKGIEDYGKYSFKKPDKSKQQPWISATPIKITETPYGGSIDGLVAYCMKNKPLCPICGEECERSPFCRQGKTTYITRIGCKEHESIYVRYELSDGALKESYYKETEDFKRVYSNKLKQKEKKLRYRELYKMANKNKKRIVGE